MNNNTFKVIDENNIERLAGIIGTFTYNNNEYLIYNIDRDNENTNIFVSRLVRNVNGFDTIKDIEDPMERDIVKNMVRELFV